MHKTDYINSFTKEPEELKKIRDEIQGMHNAHMICGPQVAAYLMATARSISAKNIFEIGCFVGYSARAMSLACPDATITTCDLSPGPIEIAKKHFVGTNVVLREMDALDALATVEGKIDLAFIDGNKGDYPVYLNKIVPKMRDYGVIIFDNCWWYGKAATQPDVASRGVHELNCALRDSNRLINTFLDIGDGVHTAVVLPAGS